MLPTRSTVKAFYNWTHNGIGYIAFPCGEGVFVVDEMSRGYGAWESVARFRKLQRERDVLSKPLPGCAYRIHAHMTHE